MHLTGSNIMRGALAADNTPAPQYVVSYRDIDPDGDFTFGTAMGTLADAVATMVAAAGDGKTRDILGIDLYNADNANATYTLSIYDGTTDYVFAEITLATLEMASWTKESGWRVLEVDGGLKQQVA